MINEIHLISEKKPIDIIDNFTHALFTGNNGLKELGTNNKLKIAEQVGLMSNSIHSICDEVEKRLNVTSIENTRTNVYRKLTKCMVTMKT